MSTQRTNSVLVFVAVLVAAIIVIYAITGSKPTTPPTPETENTAGDTGNGQSEPTPDEGVTRIDQTTDTTEGTVPGGESETDEADTGNTDTDETDEATAPGTIFEAAQIGDAAILQAMIDSGMDVNSTDEGGRTALMHAAGGGHVDAVFVLLNEGADAGVRDNARRAARDYALARADEPGQTIARILEDAVGPPPVRDASEK